MASSELNWNRWPYRIGCPVWTSKDWAGVVYPTAKDSKESLHWYSRQFSTVEGSSTFYAMPGMETFQKWAGQTPEGFQFCFKFPRSISHDAQLVDCEHLLDEFLKRLDLLRNAGRLGSTFLQLGPQFSFRYWSRLEAFLKKLPVDWPWAVEMRHADWFDEGGNESAYNDLLLSLKMDRVLFDSRPLYSLPASDEIEKISQERKPKSPFRTTVTAKSPMVRLIGRNKPEEVITYWDEWSRIVAGWIEQGLEPIVFTHAPDDAFAPYLARWFNNLVRERLERNAQSRQVEKLPEMPVKNRQLPLF